MHLLAAKPGGFGDDEGIIDLQQDPADLVFLSAQDSSLAILAERVELLPKDYPSVRLASLMHIAKPAAFDLYMHRVIEHARVVVVSLLGGRGYWQYALEQLQQRAEHHQLTLIVVPGDDQPDRDLQQTSNVDPEHHQLVWRFLREGGAENTDSLLALLAKEYLNRPSSWQPPKALPRALIFHPDISNASLADWQQQWHPEHPVALLLFYRNHIQSGNTEAFSQLVQRMQHQGINPLPIAIASLKEPACLEIVNQLCQQSNARVIINTTGFSIQGQGNAALSSYPVQPDVTLVHDIPVLQAIVAGNSFEDWQNHSQGLRPVDIAMNISLPEMDGRIITRAISFKDVSHRSERCQIDCLRYRLHDERADFVIGLAKRWSTLATKPNTQKRIALILANYPTRDGRIGNGVGLDTPNSTINILREMERQGYPISDIPDDGTALVESLLQWVTNDPERLHSRPCQQSLDLEQYNAFFFELPEENQQAILDRWGPAENDPRTRNGRIMVAGIRLGETFIGIQPARGYNLDIAANYHDPDLVPPHSYLAFYFWLRHCYQIDAIAHIGKHGNLEWLPGKSVALSQYCWPDAILGPLPHLYPFIVNDPGEGAQAKRRTQAVILDHLMPPLARAESYGELAEIELMVDELYQAMGVDTAREIHLRKKILKRLEETHLLEELQAAVPSQGSAKADKGIDADIDADVEVDSDTYFDNNADTEQRVLNELDAYLCDLKEAQIRNGLHIFGEACDTAQRSETLVALSRLPRGETAQDQGILHALVEDFRLQTDSSGTDSLSKLLFDPLKPDAGSSWQGKRPARLVSIDASPWRTEGDTRERLELFALELINRHFGDNPVPIEQLVEEGLPHTKTLFEHIQNSIAPAFNSSPANELANFMTALAGRFVPAGPSGAPSRGRLDVLPTGRNFYSVDTRSIPTPSAWELAQRSADQLLMRHLQEHGDYPRTIGISVWGTATMRTGGDDVAQALALMGVRPRWSSSSNRVIGFEVIPAFHLGRPRIDVTLRISGFFRDAFPNVIQLFDAAVQTLAEHEESGDINPIREQSELEQQQLIDSGLSLEMARQQSRWRIFGSKPGAYGAGLQGLIDERCWESGEDLARAYINWGGYAYGQDDAGTQAYGAFEQRLGELQVVVQNQDNREHDILDSDDYYQFQGGMSNAVRVLSETTPAVYHNDHSNPAAPVTRTLKEELNRVIRSRVMNPKWIKAMQQHGYKGAFEMAATVDYLFAYDATTDLIDDYQYHQVSDALLFESENQQFLKDYNPDALREMAERLLEAIQRELWQKPGEQQAKLEDLLLDLEHQFEGLHQE